MWFKDCPEEAAKALERKLGEAAQVRKCGSKIVVKRQHLLG